MPLWVGIRGAPVNDGDACPVFNPAVWWKASILTEDVRFRVVNAQYFYSVACLGREDICTLQERFRPYAELVENWKLESDRLNACLADDQHSGRWWVVTIYEWESGVD